MHISFFLHSPFLACRDHFVTYLPLHFCIIYRSMKDCYSPYIITFLSQRHTQICDQTNALEQKNIWLKT